MSWRYRFSLWLHNTCHITYTLRRRKDDAESCALTERGISPRTSLLHHIKRSALLCGLVILHHIILSLQVHHLCCFSADIFISTPVFLNLPVRFCCFRQTMLENVKPVLSHWVNRVNRGYRGYRGLVFPICTL